ncbi:MAG TPA: aminomethyl-transferring glycine dehydrogenase subunit GcvPA [Clostridia bacterium]|jgi:glycine dehydrogenase subunit 1|nr:aminomethyl-transferring glycine dehydrogenase subunit GcvPA [Clostridia bacterium]HPY98435.1 aminomethyl-transferring glycine dehydrogenase subunit GcvPA [Clostridia bacterium]HQC68313.1 aminomethyl-transferring glycine dehydrogenase subunit GcvPA [Clostridia bacterium]
MRYIPVTDRDRQEMLKRCKADSVEHLFSCIPEQVRLKRPLNLPPAKSEMELMKYMQSLAAQNSNTDNYACFLGAGAYDHYIPSVISHLISRQEFLTAYTPYQPEISQGTLTAIFEYQTMICELTGMDVANASMYDGASALAEACVISSGALRKRSDIIIVEDMHPEYRETVETYLKFRDIKYTSMTVKQLLNADLTNVAGVCVQYPSFYGDIYDMQSIGDYVKQSGSLFIVCANPVALALLKSPKDFGADFVVGEGQPLGMPLGYGGPYLGFFACVKEHMRKMPGRIVGKTTDVDGKTAYVLTLQAREQHIRREKATSNICSNQALCALTATIYLSVTGKKGFKQIAQRCVDNAHYVYEGLLKTGKFEKTSDMPFFHEFTVKPKVNIAALNRYLYGHGFIGGLETDRGWLIAVTEKRTKEEMDEFIRRAGEFNG